jgi:hypothetical protein
MTTIYEPGEETLNAVLEPLGFDHQGDFYPVEFPVEDYEFIEIGKCAIATANGYIAVLNYSIMEYWESFENSDELRDAAIKAVKELEGITITS